MDDLNKAKELQAAYLCIKTTVAEDITSVPELKLALQYAGYNPSTEEVERLFKMEATGSISFGKFSEICLQLKPLTDQDFYQMISSIFCLDSNTIKIEDFRKTFHKNFQNSNDELEDLIQVSAINEEFMSYSKLSHFILNTITKLKRVNLQRLDEKLTQKRIDSRTFTKKHKVKNSKTLKEEITDKDFEKWFNCSLKGCFFLEKDYVISHQYFFELSTEGAAVLRISPIKYHSSCLDIDTLAFLFKESSDGIREYIGYTKKREDDGSFYWNSPYLLPGKYFIIPFTSGCILQDRKATVTQDPLQLIHINDKKIVLSHEFLSILDDVFSQFDIDSNSHLNRQEFNLYNWRTSGEIVQDDEWKVLEENFDVINGELTKEGFISLHKLEAEDNGGDAADMWLSLEALGFNKMGIQDQAGPFMISVFCEASKPNLSVSGLRSGGFLLDKALVCSIIEDGHPHSLDDNLGIVRYLYEDSYRGSIIIQNQSQQNVKVRVDCSQSVNCITNRPSLDYIVEVDKKSAIIAHQLVCKDVHSPWKIISNQTIL